MKLLARSCAAATLATAALALPAAIAPSGQAVAQGLPTPGCAWGLQWTAFGLGNWAFPDTGNRWWYMPIDPAWGDLKLSGVYPKGRFFSIAVYDEAPVSTGLSGRAYDSQIEPDAGSSNPFRADRPREDARQNYTLRISRTAAPGGNVLRLNAKSGWLVYRLYLPNGGEGAMGGVPLPRVSIVNAAGAETELPPCPVVNRQSEVAAVTSLFVPKILENPPAVPAVGDRVWFAPIPNPPVRLLPNPDNKYMISNFMSEYRPGRVLVVRAKMPGYPDTYRGAPASQPAPGFGAVQLRYWSLCSASLISPLPISGCTVDAETPLDEDQFYTAVVSNDIIRPDWLPPKTAWLPWGDEQMAPKTLFIRNTLPSPQFAQSAQAAIAQGCGVEFNFPTPPDQASVINAGKCAQAVMKDYFPVAVWCDKKEFVSGGWKACLEKARRD